MGFIGDLFSSDNTGANPDSGIGVTGLTVRDWTPDIERARDSFYNAQNLQQQTAMGQGPLQTAINAQMGQGAQQAAGVYANNRAINPALAARAASGLQAQSGQQAAALKAQQQLQASQGLGQGAAQMYGMGHQALANMNQAANTNNQIYMGAGAGDQAAANSIGGGILGAAGGALGLAQGGQVPNYRNPMIEAHHHIMNMRSGGHVPGKATVQGDSQKNDTVPAMLSPGEIVIPRSKAQNPDAAKAFVEAVLSGKHKKRGK